MEDFVDHIKKGIRLGADFKLEGNFTSIVLCGVGISGVACNIIENFLKDNCSLPVIVVKDYNLPSYVNKDSLIFSLSFSGDDDEVVSSYRDAVKKFIQPIVITSGGRLKFLASQDNFRNVITIPGDILLRNSLVYFVFGVLGMLHNNKLFKLSSDDVLNALEVVKNPVLELKSRELVNQLEGKIPFIFLPRRYEGVALFWKYLLEGMSNRLCFYSLFPDQFYDCRVLNEKDNFFPILVVDEKDNALNVKKLELAKEFINKSKLKSLELSLKGNSFLVKSLTLLMVGYFVSGLLANNIQEIKN